MIILGTNSVKAAGGFDVDNSLRFNDGSSDYLSRTPSSAGNTKKFTISFWLKRGTITGADQNIFHAFPGSGSRSQILFNSSEQLLVDLEAGNTNRLITTRVFRDTSAWSNIVIVYDSDNGTSGNRVIIYINGVRETSFGTETYPSSGSTSQINTTTQHEISSYDGSGSYFDGYLAEFVLLDGTVADATSFGEFDEDSGIWKPIKVSGLTFGTNGFYQEYKQSGTGTNASGMGADTSGNTNHFAVNNLTAVDQSTDTCTNNFATLNSLIPSSASFLEGNLRCNFASSGEYGSDSSIGITSGKWYAEFKFTAGANHYLILGVNDQNGQNERSRSNGSAGKGGATGKIGYRCSDGKYRVNNSHTSYGGSGGDGDIFSIAIDKDNEKVYFAVNGTYGNSGNPANNSNGIDVSSVLTGDTWFFNVGNDTGDSETQVEANFGSPSYAISSGNADGDGFGNFEFAPPSGFFALCTKNLAEYGG